MPRSIEAFKITEKRGEVAYQLELPLQMSDVRNVFHVSQLKKCLCVREEQIPREDMDAKECDRTTSGRGSLTRINVGNSQ
jgi:hypothetical protein